jgi:hypothetical protein
MIEGRHATIAKPAEASIHPAADGLIMRLKSVVVILLLPLVARADEARPVLRVGTDQGDLRGNDQRVLQAAVDYLANLGGGTVEIGPGRYKLRHPLRLRSGVRIIGVPDKTVLVLGGGRKTALAKDVAKGATEITLKNPAGFEVGDAVALEDKAGHGFQVTTGTLVQRLSPNTFRLAEPTANDYLLTRNAEAKAAFSGVAGWHVRDALVEGLTIEGNHGQEGSEYLGGCRGGGIYLFACENVTVRRCVVRKYNGDAISFQEKCRQITIEDCLCEDNANVGMHPGSGSHSCFVRGNVLRKNGYVGLFVCVGVQRVLFEDNDIVDNAGCGISIGLNDSDNTFRGNRVVRNAETGVLFRRDSAKAEDGAHRNIFEKNTIMDNLGPRPAKSNSRPSSAGQACVVIEGTHLDLMFRDNELGFSRPHAGSAFLVDPGTAKPQLSQNRLHQLTELIKEQPKPTP